MQNNLYSFQRLKDYALWYYFRYYPSSKKLLQKLTEKWWEENTKKVYSDIEHLLQETEIIASKIDNYVFRNKNYRYIRTKMFEKWFPKEAVESYLEKYTESWKSILDTDFLRRKIDMYARKGKSKKFIYMQLSETPEDREVLEKLLDEYFVDGEQENIDKEYQKLKDKYPRQKILQKLLEKWFSYDEVRRHMN